MIFFFCAGHICRTLCFSHPIKIFYDYRSVYVPENIFPCHDILLRQIVYILVVEQNIQDS